MQVSLMVDYFPDTSVIMCGAHSYEQYHDKAVQVIKTEFLVSPLVYEELRDIQNRREIIYNSILKVQLEAEWTIEDVYKKCFKANSSNVVSDSQQLEVLFAHIVTKLNLQRNIVLTPGIIDQLTIEISDSLNTIRYFLLEFFIKLGNPETRNKRIAVEDVSGRYKRLVHRLLQKEKNPKRNKNDLRILAHGVEHSCHHNLPLDIVCKDAYMASFSTIAKEAANYVFRRPSFFNVYHIANLPNPI